MTEQYSGNYSSIAVDDVKESYKIVDYLIKLGHKKILLISASAEDESIGKLRKVGYENALKDNGIEIDDSLIVPMSEDADAYSMKAGFITMERALNKKLDFTAVYPSGNKVLLNTGETAIVVNQNKGFPERPMVQLVMNQNGVVYDKIEVRNLLEYPNIFIDKVLN